jgi:hypothetical protein
MKSIEVSDRAFNYIENAHKNEDQEIVATDIANSLSILASMIQAGRDDESINVWTDDLLRVMATIAEYNNLYSAIAETTDNKLGNFKYQEQPDKESEELESIRKTSEHIGTSVKLWLSVNSPDEAIEVLTECENQVEESDKEKFEILHEVTSLIAQIKKDVQNED